MSDKKVDEINLKDLSKKIAQSSGNKNLQKALKPSVDKTKSDLAAMRKRLDALKAGYAAESVEPIEEAMKNTHALIDTADGNKVVAMASSENGVKQSRTSAERPPMSIKNKNTLKIVTLTKPQSQKASEKMIGRPLPSNMDKFPTNVSASQGKRLGEAKQVLAHGGKGQYKIVSDGGAISVMFKGKVVGKGDFDRGADSFFISMKGQKGQKSFDDAQDIADYFAKMKIKEEVQIDEVLDTPKAMQSYRDKAKYSADRAASSAAAKILRGKDKDGNRADHSPEVKTRDKRAKGAELANRNATRKTFNRLRNEMTEGGMKRMATTQSNKADRMASGGKKGLETFKKKPADLKKGDTVVPNKGPHKGHPHTIIHDFGDGHYNISPDNLTGRQIKYSLGAAKAKASDLKLHKEEVQEASKEGTIRIIDLGRMGKGKGFQVQRMTKGKFVDQGKPYKSQKDAEKVRKDGQHSMQFEAAPKMKGDWLKKERERNREHDAAMGRTATGRKKPTRTMTSTQNSLASLRKEMNEKYKLHHKTMSAALQHAYDEVEKKGYEIDKDDIDNKVAMGPRKPSSGKTNSYNLGLSKNGKPVKQKLHIQVYNMDNKGYELNMYVS